MLDSYQAHFTSIRLHPYHRTLPYFPTKLATSASSWDLRSYGSNYSDRQYFLPTMNPGSALQSHWSLHALSHLRSATMNQLTANEFTYGAFYFHAIDSRIITE